jgi:SAM-dependent methyltransferase
VPDATVNPDSGVYYQGGYWNDLAQVRAHLNRRATGDPDVEWWQHLIRWRGGSFKKALILNCGNGWVERDLVSKGVVAEAVGVDFLDDLLAAARAEAAKEDLPLRYYQLDTNTAKFPEDGYDLVVNFAACHHIARLDRVFRRLAEMLPADGVLVSWDYVGAHRNQYPTAHWERAWQVNKELPEDLRQHMDYPHLPTMLATDPTEAIHAELILDMMKRYFAVDYARTLGGAVAYPLLTFNKAIHALEPEAVADAVAQVLDADAAFTDRDPFANTMFAYLIASPRKDVLSDAAQLARWADEEDAREDEARQNGGMYYPRTMISEYFEYVYAARNSSPSTPTPTGAPPLSRFAALRANPRLRARVARIPGARRTYRWLRAHRPPRG